MPLLIHPEVEVPPPPATPQFRLEPLDVRHNAADLRAWSTSIAHIRATPGFAAGDWPPAEPFTPERNELDLRGHAKDFADRTGFTYTVLEPGGDVVGCVYLYPARDAAHDVRVRSWVRADRAELDVPLHDVVLAWLAHWPFSLPDYAPRR